MSNSAHAIDVVFLTPQGPKPLKSWGAADLSRIISRKAISAQKLIIEESTKSMEQNDLADVDLITIYGEEGVARVPRFMIWRGFLKLEWDKNEKSLHSSVSSSSRLVVPAQYFRVKKIKKIELTKHGWIYPGTVLKIRTNPAASRGEKLFTQSCLACHSLSGLSGASAHFTGKSITFEQLTTESLSHFSQQHRDFPQLVLDARANRGLQAYSQALASEKNEVKSPK